MAERRTYHIEILMEEGEGIAEPHPGHAPIHLVSTHTPANRWGSQGKGLKVESNPSGRLP